MHLHALGLEVQAFILTGQCTSATNISLVHTFYQVHVMQVSVLVH